MKRASLHEPVLPVLASRFRQVPPTEREQQLQQQIEKLRQQLQEQKEQGPMASAGQFTSCPATESALLDLLADDSVDAARVAHLVAAFPMADRKDRDRRQLARQCWEHLLEGSADGRRDIGVMVAKMNTLRMHRLYCPKDVWKQQSKLETVELLVEETFGCQRLVGQLLVEIYRCLDADAQGSHGPGTKKSDQLRKKLDCADLLLVALALAKSNVCLVTVRQQQVLEVVHLARHGPCNALKMLLDQQPRVASEGSVSLVNEMHHGFPVLFQPLLACQLGWLDRLTVLLEAGANAGMTYATWNCSALHMLCYRKAATAPRRLSEEDLVNATRLLLTHGAKAVINLTDRSNDDSVHHRTALIQAASAGRLRLCRVLLEAGADASVSDSKECTMLDYLFYVKHSYLGIHRNACHNYTCMQLYALVNDFRLQELLTEELKHDCHSCGRCRFLLATCSSASDSSSSAADTSESETSEEEEAAASTLSTIATVGDPASTIDEPVVAALAGIDHDIECQLEAASSLVAVSQVMDTDGDTLMVDVRSSCPPCAPPTATSQQGNQKDKRRVHFA